MERGSSVASIFEKLLLNVYKNNYNTVTIVGIEITM